MEELNYYLKELRKLPVLTVEREKEICAIMLNSDVTDRERKKIEKELIEGNLRFVITVARKFINKNIPLEDLIAEGNVGLIRAINTFDWSKGNRFLSYAVWWIRQAIFEALHQNSNTIRIPVNVTQDIQKLKKEGLELPEKYNTLPKMVEIDKTINDDGDTMLDIIINKDSENPDASFYNNDELNKKTHNMLDQLNEKEQFIIKEYYGFTGSPRTLEDIGDEIGLTKERIRQIKEKGLQKLRNDAKELFDYIY